MSSENTAAHKTAPAAPKSALDRYFKITERGSTLATEFRGGLATFFAMAYIVVLNPLILGLGPDGAGNTLGVERVAAATALIAGILTIVMGLWAKQPFAMAAGLGVNALLASTIATNPNLTWPQIMGLVVWAGIIMGILVLTGFRRAVFDAVPESLKTAIVVGIGLFISLIGLVNAGIVRRMPDAAGTTVPVSFGAGGHLQGWPIAVFLFGLFLTIALFIRNVRGAILIGVVASTILAVVLETVWPSGSSMDSATGWSLMVPGIPSQWVGHPDLSLIGAVDMTGAFAGSSLGSLGATMLMFAILLAVFFDVMGTSVGLATEAGTIKDGKIENIDRVLIIDAAGSVLGGGSSSSAHQIFVESATGIGEGARTGFANIVTGTLFLLAVFISPLVSIVPFEAVAPALVIVGFLMVRQAIHIDWTDWGLGIPAFLTIIMMPFTYSIADGIGAGFVAFTFIRMIQGRGREVHPIMYVVSAAFLVFFGMGVIEGWIH
ncbi:NCS2 family permease [Rothia sp. P100]|uniref:NCS2 family permease n=1 Tax=unclassified Rothia (in: high G+C Gram-positive bacteria) TaxID=2689056 RepID=UPI00203C1D62|nr:NCS2 family permease [Rothia sp. P100]MCM3510024.1 NCS2 family permease [Rothia sp. P100]